MIDLRKFFNTIENTNRATFVVMIKWESTNGPQILDLDSEDIAYLKKKYQPLLEKQIEREIAIKKEELNQIKLQIKLKS
jgi:hypothetical protein